MIEIPIPVRADLDRGIRKTYMDTVFATEDDKAHRFDVALYRGNEPVTLTSGATVSAYFIRYSDNGTLPMTGAANGNVVSVTLTKACYNKGGAFALIIKVIENGVTSTVFYGEGSMFISRTDTLIDQENVIPSLEELLAMVSVMENATEEAATATASASTAAAAANNAAQRANTEADAAKGWAEATATAVTLEAGNDADVNISTASGGAKRLEFSIPRGESGVYVGTEEPTDPTVQVWIDPDGEADEMPSGVTTEELRAAVNAYLDAHPVTSGATAQQAAQIQKNKEAIQELQQNGTGSGLTDAQISALNGMFKVAAYVKADISAEYAAFKTAFGIEDSDDPVTPDKTLTGISAAYSGGDVAVGTALTALTGITVTATYSDGSTATVTDYTLSGEIAEGTNTITVSYGGMTTTITVTGVAESGGDNTGVSNDTTWTDGVPYTMTLTADTYIDANNGSVKSDEDWSSTNQLYCAGASRITFKQSDGVAVVNSRYNAFFDSDKQFVSSFTMSANGIDVPENAAYVALSNKTTIMSVLLATPVA